LGVGGSFDFAQDFASRLRRRENGLSFQRAFRPKPAFWNADTMMHHVVGERMILISMQRDVLVDRQLPPDMPKFWKLPESKKRIGEPSCEVCWLVGWSC
jgi:hypothetical protein